METKTGKPVESFPMEYTWQIGAWEQLFDKQDQADFDKQSYQMAWGPRKEQS